MIESNRICGVTNIDGLTLVVYYTAGSAYQFEVLCPPPDDDLYRHEKIFYTPEAAEREGRKWIQRVFGVYL